MLWDWELAATTTQQIWRGPRTYEAWVTQRPAGWYMIADHMKGPQGPYLTYALAADAARHAVMHTAPADAGPEGKPPLETP
jgi:hypothetical protein